MKIRNYLILLLLPAFSGFQLNAQTQSGIDSTGLPGDNFSLQGALEMFQRASSPEEFEKFLNTESNRVNNLDLNGDGNVDYIKVIDKSENDIHVFILQVPVSEKESQDIAVIELEKTGDASAMVQIVGDEDIYGEEVIVEPDSGEGGIESKAKGGPSADLVFYNPKSLIAVNVWHWPSVRFIYGPLYRPWISPWRWRSYPVWWRPWHPVNWHVWHPFHYRYHRSFVIVNTHRVVRAHAFYRPSRTSSVIVRTRHSKAIGNYRVSRTRTTVTGPRGNSATVKKTTVQGPGKKTKVRRVTVKKRRG